MKNIPGKKLKALSLLGGFGSSPDFSDISSCFRLKYTFFNNRGNLLIILAGILIALGGCSYKTKVVPMEVGVRLVNITPPANYPIYRGNSTGVSDSLYARAIVFKQGDKKGALLICDLLTIPRNLSRIVREHASKQSGIPFQNISVTATHTHTSPSNREAIRIYAEHQAKNELTEEDQQSYIGHLIKDMTEAIVIADKNTEEVELTTGIGQATGVSFNRRYLMTNGRIGWNPGRLNPRIVHPAGPVDTDVHFILFRPVAESEFSTSLTVFANHPDTKGGMDFSADYPFYLQERLKQIFGDQLVSVFGLGPCGNINHIDVSQPSPVERGVITEKTGIALAEAINSALSRSEQFRPSFEVISKTVFLPLQDYTDEDLKWAKEDRDRLAPVGESPRGKLSFMENVKTMKILSLEEIRQNEAIPPTVSGEPWRFPVEIQIFRVNNQTAIITVPGEIFVQLSNTLKERSPFANTILIELANSDIRYVPTRLAYAEGAYEPLQSRLAPGSGETMIEEMLEMLQSIAPK